MCTRLNDFNTFASQDHQSESDDDVQNSETANYGILSIGDRLVEEKEEGVTRLYFQNLNGIKWDTHGGTWPMICQAMAATHTDILCFAEINQDTSQFPVRHGLVDIARKHFDHIKLVTSMSKSRTR